MIPLSGTLDLSTVRTELGAAGAFDLGGANVRSLAGVPTGPLDLSTLRGGIWIGASENAANIFTKAGSPGSAVAVRAVVAAAAVVGSTAPGTPALAFGNFPAGSTVTVDNYGIVQGAGGLPNGGVGGHAIHAQTSAAFTKTINNKAGATVRAGGGAGGYGGTGGVGGQGGPGTTTVVEGPFYTLSTYEVQNNISADTWSYFWNGANLGTFPNSTASIGGIDYEAVAFQSGNAIAAHWSIKRTTTGTNTPGGAGGAGGAGGRGQGYDGANAAGAGGAAGAAGSGGSGAGGTGGTGGTGGGWGAAAAGGGTGSTGAAGSGGAGSAGSGGFGGGSAGSYLYAGGQAVTFNNAGTVAGNLS
jgi:hypothetical protein